MPLTQLYQLMQTNNGWQLLGAILVLGAITMALLQVANELLPVRALFHARWLRGWIRERAEEFEVSIGRMGPRDSSLTPKDRADRAFGILVAQSAGGHWRPFLGLPAAQLVGQVNAAAQMALEYPARCFALLSVLAQPAWKPGRLVSSPRDALQSDTLRKDLETLLEHEPHEQPRPARKAAKAASVPPPPAQDYLNARNRVGHAVQRNLDGMQIALANSTSVWTQALAMIISLALVLWAWFSARGPLATLLDVALIGAAAGFVAPVLGDIVTAIRRFGQQ